MVWAEHLTNSHHVIITYIVILSSTMDARTVKHRRQYSISTKCNQEKKKTQQKDNIYISLSFKSHLVIFFSSLVIFDVITD